MKRSYFLLLLSLTGINAASALQNPLAYPADPRITMVAYQPHNVVEVRTNTFTSTQIIFAKDESVINIDGGDTAVWSVTNQKVTPNVVSIKPNHFGANSNLTIFTNKRIYYFHLTSNPDLKTSFIHPLYAVQFVYPDRERAKTRALLLKRKVNKNSAAILHYIDYTFNGNPRLQPLHVFDDGTFTYFEFAPQTEIPAIFAVDGTNGQESLVNDYRQGKYIVVKRVAPQFTLRAGKDCVASVFNIREIKRIKGK